MARAIWEDIPTWVNHDKKKICYTPVKNGHTTIYNILIDDGYERINEHMVDLIHHKTDEYMICPFYEKMWEQKHPSYKVDDPIYYTAKPLQECLGYDDYTSYLFVRHPVSRFFSGLLTELNHSAATMVHQLAHDDDIDHDYKMQRLISMFKAYMVEMWSGELDKIILPNICGQFASHCWVLTRDYYKDQSIYDYVDHLVSFDTSTDDEFKGAVNIANVKQLTTLGIVDEIKAEHDYSHNSSHSTLYKSFYEALTPEFLREVEDHLYEECVHIKCNEHKLLGKPQPTPLYRLMVEFDETFEPESDE